MQKREQAGGARTAPFGRWLRRRSAAALALMALGGVWAGNAGAVEPWGFEQVTPVSKGSGVVSAAEMFISSPDGQRLLHTAYLPYDDGGPPVTSAPLQSRYLAARSGDGWVNQALDPPYVLRQTPTTTALFVQATLATSPNLRYALIATRVPLTPGADPAGGSVYLKDTKTGALTLVLTTRDQDGFNATLTTQGAGAYSYLSNDGRSAIFSFMLWDGTPLVPGGPSTGFGLYSWSAEAGLRYEARVGGAPVAVLNLPGADEAGPRDNMPLDERGLDHVYYQINSGSVAASPVYVSEGPSGARTSRLVSYSRLVSPPPVSPVPTGAVPLAVSGGGRFALIRTGNNVPLAGGEPSVIAGTSRLLYRYDAEANSPASELEFIGVVPNVARVVQMSQDGKTIIFYSTITQAGSPTGSQHKLFVWREGHGLEYIYSADAGSSGTNLQNQLRRLSDNARYLSFTDNSATLAAGFGMTNIVSAGCPNALLAPGPCDQVYRYDIERDVLDCVSCRRDGAAPLGASGTSDRSVAAGKLYMNNYQSRTVANDGTVFFTSRDALVPRDRNALDDVYAWSADGGLRLLSRATPGKRSRFLDASSDGGVVFLASRDRLAATDEDEEDDVYVTYAGAGFASVAKPPVVASCSGGDCRGAFSPLPVPPAPGTERPGRDGSVSPTRSRTSVRVHWARMRKGRLEVRVRASSAGRIRVTGARIRSSAREFSKAGVYTIKARLTKKSARRLKARGRLAVRVRATLSPSFGDSARDSYHRTVKR